MFTREDYIDDLHEDLGRARRNVRRLENIGVAQVVNEPEMLRAYRKATDTVAALERELAELLAQEARDE